MMPELLVLCFALAAPAADDVKAEAPAQPRSVSVRAARPVTVAFELGNSGLAGMGFTFSYSFTPQWAVDAGLGWSVFGPKLGARGRFNFLDRNVTPFVGGGLMVAAAPWVDPEVVPMAQAVGGVSWITDGGFSLLASLGWMQRLDGRPGSWSTPISWTGSDVAYTVATGYSF